MIPARAIWSSAAVEQTAASVAAAAGLGDQFELHPVQAGYPQLRDELRSIAPAVLIITDGLLAVTRIGRRTSSLIGPDGRRYRPSSSSLAEAVAADLERTVAAENSSIPPRGRRSLLRARMADQRLDMGWRVRCRTGAPLRMLAHESRLSRWIAAVLSTHVLVYLVFVAVWAIVGGAAAHGELDREVLASAIGLLVLLAPLRMLAVWSAGVLTVRSGALLKRRLIGSILGLQPDQVRHQGAGQLLGVMMEAEALETLALTGGYAGLLAVAELAAAAVALTVGIRPGVLLSLLMLWIGLAVGLARVYLNRRRAWSRTRLDLTHDLVERMTGHRTRQAQAGMRLYDLQPDRAALSDYERTAKRMDRAASALNAAIPRGWMLAGLTALLLPLPAAVDPARLAASIGGVVLAFHALEKLTQSLAQLADATVAWDKIRPLTRASGMPPPNSSPPRPATVEAKQISYSYNGNQILTDVSTAIRQGDRILLQGPSGAGKSTLAAVLAGLREPSSGTVTGTQAVSMASQFHENHLLSASVAFNLLLGRHWPPTPDDMREAQDLCEELGLGSLLADMPAGIQQPVGEVGWQLSHGQRSRLYAARALLSEHRVLVLDESLAALDPEAMQRTLAAVTQRAGALVVIAHE